MAGVDSLVEQGSPTQRGSASRLEFRRLHGLLGRHADHALQSGHRRRSCHRPLQHARATDITPEYYRAYFRGLPYGCEEVYDRHSPMRFVQRVKTPCLVLHGEQDTRVPVSQGWEF